MKKNRKLRSQEWFGGNDKMGFVHRSWLRNQGYPDDQFRGKPVIGICNTWSELTPCNGHLRDFSPLALSSGARSEAIRVTCASVLVSVMQKNNQKASKIHDSLLFD